MFSSFWSLTLVGESKALQPRVSRLVFFFKKKKISLPFPKFRLRDGDLEDRSLGSILLGRLGKLGRFGDFGDFGDF